MCPIREQNGEKTEAPNPGIRALSTERYPILSAGGRAVAGSNPASPIGEIPSESTVHRMAKWGSPITTSDDQAAIPIVQAALDASSNEVRIQRVTTTRSAHTRERWPSSARGATPQATGPPSSGADMSAIGRNGAAVDSLPADDHAQSLSREATALSGARPRRTHRSPPGKRRGHRGLDATLRRSEPALCWGAFVAQHNSGETSAEGRPAQALEGPCIDKNGKRQCFGS